MEQNDRSVGWPFSRDLPTYGETGQRLNVLLVGCVVGPLVGLLGGLLIAGGDMTVAQSVTLWRTWLLPAVLLVVAVIVVFRVIANLMHRLERAGRDRRFLTYQVRRTSLATSLTRHSTGALQQITDCLSSIETAAGWIGETRPGARESDLMDHLAQVRSSVQRGKRAVATLQALTGTEQNATLIQDINLEDLLDGLVRLLEWECYLRRIVIRRQYVGSTVRLRGDRTRVRQVCQHLLTNALEAVDHDGWILVDVDDGDEAVTLCVVDSGPGIPETRRDQVFEAMYTTRADHVGLGLSISRQLAREMQGSLDLVDHPDAGACFVLTLPRRVGAPALANLGT